MFSRGFGKLCFVAALVEVLLGWNSVYSSSIYVGRHEAGTYTEEKPSEGVLSEGKVLLMRARMEEMIRISRLTVLRL